MADAEVVTILGIHQVHLDDDELEELAQQHAGGDFEATREEIELAVLVECLCIAPDQRRRSFDADAFALSNAQVPWLVTALTPDGESVLEVERPLLSSPSCLPYQGSLRVAFFLHCWDEGLPLLLAGEPIAVPEITDLPDRLEELMPYRCVD